MEKFQLFFKNLNYFFTPEVVSEENKNWTIVDLLVLLVTRSQEQGHLGSPHEQIANIVFFTLPKNYWSIIDIEVSLYYLIISILVLPLIFLFVLVFLFIVNQIWVWHFGKIDLFEDKSINFSILQRDYWRIVWAYVHDVTPRFMAIKNVLNKNYRTNLTYPNPHTTFLNIPTLFLISVNKRYFLLWLHILLFIGIWMLNDFSTTTVLLAMYVISLGMSTRKLVPYSFLQFGKLKFSSLTKPNKLIRGDFSEYLYAWNRYAYYPIFSSFFLFLLINLLIIYLYLAFFFQPILTWNGYFSQTIISFFFSDSSSIFKPNQSFVFDYFLALDGLNVWLIWLTALLIFLCSIFLLETVCLATYFKQMCWIYLLGFASFQFFCVPNYFWMYVYFELSLLPIFVLIIYWGSNRRKIHAAYQMVLFTFIGSVFLLSGILLIFLKLNTFNCFDIFYVTQSEDLNQIFTSFEKKLIWILLFIGFAIKTPLYPFHIWLPEAHSEAPTTGSVMLAGVLLKMGTYGFLRFVIPIFPSVLETFKTLVFTMCLCGIIFSSLAALAQIDIKKIIAYSSIGHMGLVILGAYTMTMNGILGASYMMISHGLISSALFFSIGMLYKIYGTRSLVYYNSLAHFMPWFSMTFFFFSMANMSFPGTAGFPGELLIFASLMADNFFFSLFVGFGSILGGVYSIWLLTRVLYGQISPKIAIYRDLKTSERKILNFLLILILFFGLFPYLILDFFKPMGSFFIGLKNF